MKFATRVSNDMKSVQLTIESWTYIEDTYSVGPELDGIISQIEELADELKSFREKAVRENDLQR